MEQTSLQKQTQTKSTNSFQELWTKSNDTQKNDTANNMYAQMRDIAKKEDFRWFVYNIFSACFLNSPTGFIGGEYVDDVCEHIDNNLFTMDISGRDHFKSTRLYADIMYRLLTEADTGFEAWYFSFSQKFA